MRLPRYCPNARYSQGPLAALRAALTFRVLKDPSRHAGRGERLGAWAARHEVDDATRSGLCEGQRRHAAVHLHPLQRLHRQIAQIHHLVVGAAERDAVEVHLHLAGREAAHRHGAELPEAAEAAHLHTRRRRQGIGERAHAGGGAPCVDDGGEAGDVGRRGLRLARRRCGHHDLVQALRRLVLRAGAERDERDERARCEPSNRDPPAPSPRKVSSLVPPGRSSGSGIALTRRLPAPDTEQWWLPGSSPLTAAGQRGIRTPFPRPTRSWAKYSGCGRSSRHAPERARFMPPAGGIPGSRQP